MTASKKTQQHIVVFRDEDGSVLKTAFVVHGRPADPPPVADKKGETAHHEIRFLGWDKDIDQVTDNMVVYAKYGKIPKEYLIMYINDDGSLLGTESVAYGSAAKMPWQPEKEMTGEYEYEFAGWNTDLQFVEKDTMAKARFRKIRRRFPVRFLNEDDSVIREDTVLYGKAAKAPADPKKEEDLVYCYAFAGWDRDFSKITEPTDIRARFTPVYKEYRISFYEEDRQIGTENLHYGDPITYPALKRKGYTVCWTPEPDKVSEDIVIRADFIFTNPKGALAEDGDNLYEITNPSPAGGAVCCLHYVSGKKRVKLPESVLLGDYYYRIEEVGHKAFADCDSMEILDLPDTVRVLRDESLSGCHHLKEIILGKGVRKIGRHAFSENTRLSRITLRSDTIHSVHREAFDRMDTPVLLYVRKVIYDRRFCVFERALGLGSVDVRMLR